jgi:hypothetical protein
VALGFAFFFSLFKMAVFSIYFHKIFNFLKKIKKWPLL